MSSFFVSKATIDACVAAINHNATYCSAHGMLYATSNDTLGKDLWELNRDAINARYRSDLTEDWEMEAKIAGYKYRTTRPVMVQMLKSIQCLIYQCSEGNIPERELYKQLETVAALLKDRIVSDLPIYQNAAWDL